MTTKDIIQKTVNDIEACIEDVLNAEQLAEKAGYSVFYFHRVFSAYTGLNLASYIRRRKLEHAMCDVVAGKRLVDIAMIYGYGSERAFSRAFLNHFGSTPSAYRNRPFTLEPPIVVYEITLPKNIGGHIMSYLSKVNFKTLAPMTVASHTIISENPEEEVIAYVQAIMREHDLPMDTEQYGFDSPVSAEEEQAGKRGYEYWVKVPADWNENRLSLKTIPSYQYATIRITDPFENPFDKIPSGWKALVKWIEENKVHSHDSKGLRSANCLEQVVEIDGVTYMDIMIPIKAINP